MVAPVVTFPWACSWDNAFVPPYCFQFAKFRVSPVLQCSEHQVGVSFRVPRLLLAFLVIHCHSGFFPSYLMDHLSSCRLRRLVSSLRLVGRALPWCGLAGA